MSELRYVPADDDDADWWRATEPVADATPDVAIATPCVAPKKSRVDLVLYLQSLTPAEAICWLEHGRPDRRLG